MEQMLLAKHDEAGVNLTDEQNDFLLVDALQMKEIEELSANICLMVRIQPATLNMMKYQNQSKIINNTIDDDQIDSNVVFDVPIADVNSGNVEDDNDDHRLSELEQLAMNAYREAEKQSVLAKQIKIENKELAKQLEVYKEKVWVFDETKENTTNYFHKYIEADLKAKRSEQESQTQFVQNRDKIRDLEKQRDDLDLYVVALKRQTEELQKTQLILKHKMSEKEDKYHDTVLDLKAKVKKNEDTMLKIGNSMQGMFMFGPKPMAFYDSKLKHRLGDTEDILKDATKSQIKMKNKMKDPVAIQKNQEEIRLNYFCQEQLKPILYELQAKLESLQQRFFKDIIEMKDAFDSTENEPNQKLQQNEFLKDQLLEVTIKNKVECCVLLNHDCVDNNLQDEFERLQRESVDIQEGLNKRINILENDVQICQKQSLDFELQLQHEKERRACESSLKSVCENSWISKMDKLEHENVSLEFQVQSLIKERENIKLEYQKLFDSIKKTRAQTQGEINELIENVRQKTYMYADVRAQNQELLTQIVELKLNQKNVDKGLSATSSVRRQL
ncbi:hypothetical protein Tco_0885213 [Tanacetum coccineum]